MPVVEPVQVPMPGTVVPLLESSLERAVSHIFPHHLPLSLSLSPSHPNHHPPTTHDSPLTTTANLALSFQGGNGGRPATEFTFLPADQANFGGRGEALNPNIITNFMCNNLVNNCGKSAAARDLVSALLHP